MRKIKLFTLLAGLLFSAGTMFADPVASGTCGSGVTWELTGTSPYYTLTISGTGAMENYTGADQTPWYENYYYLHIKTIVIGDGVTSIGNYAFKDFSNLTDVNFSSSVNLTTIGDYAFSSAGYYYVDNLPITLPEGLLSIGASCFYSTRFTNVNLPSTLQTIGNEAFRDSKMKGTLTIPASVTNIGYGITSGCSAIESITVANGNTTYESGSSNAIIKKASPATLVAGCINTVIPNTVKVIGKLALSYINTETITIPEGVETLANQALAGCRYLTTINIPSTLNSIEEYALSYCRAVSSITVASGNTTYESPDNCNAIIEKSTHKLIMGCKNTTIPEGVTTIGSDAFYNVTEMEEITLPSTLAQVDNQAFYNCTGIKKITCLSTTPPTINAAYSFSGITKSEVDVYVPAGCLEAYTANYAWNLFHLIASEPCEYAGEIGESFSWTVNRCTGELTITGSGEMPYFSSEEDVPWKDKKDVITDITIPNNIETISQYAYSNCPNLETVTFEAPSQVREIGYEAFANCSKLTEITLPESLTNLDPNAFYGCDNLANLAFKSTTPPFTEALNLPYGITITYPDGSDDAYVNNANIAVGGAGAELWWNNLYNETTNEHAPAPHATGTTGNVSWDFTMAYDPNRIDITPSFNDLRGTLTISGTGAMGDASYGSHDWPEYYMNNIHYIVIENGVTVVGENAFFGAQNLRTVNMPASITNIKDDAFKNCGDITYGVSLYITADPASLTWTDNHDDFYDVSGYSADEALMKAAHCYVPAQYIAGYQAKTNVNVVFVPSGLSDISDATTINSILTELNGQVVEQATITRPVPRDGYFFTLCVPFDVPAADISFSTLQTAEIMTYDGSKKVDEEIQVYFKPIRSGFDGIEAGKPYLVRFPTSTALDKMDFSNVTVKNIEPTEVKYGDVTMVGTYVPKYVEQQTSATSGAGIMFLKTENLLSWPAVGGTIKPFRCYFKVKTGSGGGGAASAPRFGMPARIVVRENTATGMDEIQNEVRCIKTIEDGQMVIIRNGAKYNAAGQMVK